MQQPRWSPRDVVPAVVATLLVPVATRGAQYRIGADRDLDALGVALLVLAGAALLWRRRQPVGVLAVVTVAISVYLWLGYAPGPSLLAFLLAVYSIAAHRPLRVAAVAVPLAGLLLLSHLLAGGDRLIGPGAAIGTAWALVGLTVGVSVRTWRESQTRERDAQLRRHLDAERLQLSRDVHDVVGHGLAAINMQAKVALRSVDRDDERGRARVRESLEAISASSGAALDELRAVLARIPGADEEPARRPNPGLADVPALAARLARTGVRVDVRDNGEPRPLPPAQDLAAYRVAQEALTNALRHGDQSSPVTVVIDRRADGVVLEVANVAGPGRAPAEPRDDDTGTGGSGMGLPGMRDRVAAAGGTLDIDPGPPRFVVRATLPTEEAP